MNKFLKALSVLAILTISSASLAYEWNFTNITDKILVIQVRLKEVADNFFNIVGPGQKTSFRWAFGSGARASTPFEYIAIGEYDEKKAKNFPDTNSSQLPKESGKSSLHTTKISAAIDARGEWFNSLNNIPKNNDPALFILDSDRLNNLIKKFNLAATKLMTGTSIKQTLTSLNIDIPKEIQSSLTLDDIPSGAPLSQFKSNSVRGTSRDFFIVEHEGKLALVTKR